MTPKILVVDDSENIRSVLQMNFEWLGYDVIAAGDGEEAIKLVEHEHPDLIILDVMMPRKNGYQVCRQFKTDPRTASIPVILLTAKSQQEDVYWGRDCGADEYMTKPFSTPDLEAAVQRLLIGGRPPAPVAVVEGASPLEQAVGQRVREGYVGGVCTFLLEPEALTIHRQKYGELRHRQLVERVEHLLEEVLREEGFPAVVERGADAFRVLLPCTMERVKVLQDAIVERGNRLLAEHYDEADRMRGHIASRDFRTGQERHVPLLVLRAGSTEFFNQD